MQAQQKLGKDASKTKGTKALTDKKGKESAKAEEAIVEQAKNAVKETVKGATKKIAALDEDDISDDEDEELDSEDEDEDEDEDEETAALLAAMSDSDDEEASEVAYSHLWQSWVYLFVARISTVPLALRSTCITKSKPTAVKGRLESGVVTYIMLAPWF